MQSKIEIGLEHFWKGFIKNKDSNTIKKFFKLFQIEYNLNKYRSTQNLRQTEKKQFLFGNRRVNLEDI